MAMATVPMGEEPSMKVTVPLRAEAGAPGTDRGAVSCVGWRTMMGAGAATREKVGARAVTVREAPGVAVLGAKMPEPE